MLPDAIHPAKEGAAILAKCVYSAITGDYGGLQLSELYSDNMVLQRERVLKIAGKADAHEKVIVTIGKQKQTAQTTIGAMKTCRFIMCSFPV